MVEFSILNFIPIYPILPNFSKPFSTLNKMDIFEMEKKIKIGSCGSLLKILPLFLGNNPESLGCPPGWGPALCVSCHSLFILFTGTLFTYLPPFTYFLFLAHSRPSHLCFSSTCNSPSATTSFPTHKLPRTVSIKYLLKQKRRRKKSWLSR